MVLKDYLRILAARDGSDLYLTVDAPPAGKFQGSLKALDKIKMTPELLHDMAYALMDKEQQQQFAHKPEMNLAISEEGIGRFRVNIFRQARGLGVNGAGPINRAKTATANRSKNPVHARWAAPSRPRAPASLCPAPASTPVAARRAADRCGR